MVEERLCPPVIDGKGPAVPWWDLVFSLRLFSLRLEKLMKPFPLPPSKYNRAGMGMKRLLNWGTAFSIEAVRVFSTKTPSYSVSVLLSRT